LERTLSGATGVSIRGSHSRQGETGDVG